MNILYLTYFFNGALMLLAPIALGLFIGRKFKLPARIWWIGAATFILSQVGHIPFNAGLTALFQGGYLPAPPEHLQLIFNAIVLGLSAGLWEEVFRYLAYRFWAKDARSWSRGLLLGAGHGGIEAIFLGVLVLVNYAAMIVMKDMNITALVPANQIELAQQQMNAYWSAPWYATLLGAVERVFSLTFHLSASILVLQVFIRKQLRWLWIAVGWHTFLDALAVYAASTWGVYITEVLLAVIAGLSVGIILKFKTPEPVQEIEAPITDSGLLNEIKMPEIDETLDTLDQTRFQ
jgi:uncharacterized membrane protein YhfC